MCLGESPFQLVELCGREARSVPFLLHWLFGVAGVFRSVCRSHWATAASRRRPTVTHLPTSVDGALVKVSSCRADAWRIPSSKAGIGTSVRLLLLLLMLLLGMRMVIVMVIGGGGVVQLDLATRGWIGVEAVAALVEVVMRVEVNEVPR